MEAPKCKLCGTRHYGICLTLPENPVKSVSLEAKKPVDTEVSPKKIGYDRNAYHKRYMREYMRKRRNASKVLGS